MKCVVYIKLDIYVLIKKYMYIF